MDFLNSVFNRLASKCNGSPSINIDITGALFCLRLSIPWFSHVKTAPMMSMFIKRLLSHFGASLRTPIKIVLALFFNIHC